MDILVKEMEKNQNACRRYMTEEGYENYKKGINREKISTIWDKNTSVQEKFNEWSLAVTEIYKKHEQVKKPKKKKKTKTMRLLMKEKRKLKLERAREPNKETKDNIHKKIQQLKEQIIEEEKDQKGRILVKACESITNQGRFDSRGFWDLQSKINKKPKETPHAVLTL